jgi:hypothetical protein
VRARERSHTPRMRRYPKRRILKFWLMCTGLAATGCGDTHTRVEFYGNEFSWAERARIEQVSRRTADEVRVLLPQLPLDLLLKVRTGIDVIPETGESGAAFPPATVIWTVDPGHAGGMMAVVNRELRASLFHEFHHLVRYAVNPTRSLLDEAVSEGMATVFEDAAGPRGPWGTYGPEVVGWLDELRALPPDTKRRDWFGRHPDGRRWIGYRVGSYLTDTAIRASGETAASLATRPTADVLRMAGTDQGISRGLP